MKCLKPAGFHQSHSGMPKRHQEPVLVFRELKPKFAVSAHELRKLCTVWLKAQGSRLRLLKYSRVRKLWSVPALCSVLCESPRGPEVP